MLGSHRYSRRTYLARRLPGSTIRLIVFVAQGSDLAYFCLARTVRESCDVRREVARLFAR